MTTPHNNPSPATRRSRVNGLFYPAAADELATTVDHFLHTSDKTCSARVVAAPHAGYAYSGRVAANAIVQLPPDIDTVVVIGPSHVERFSFTSIFPGSGYETPLGVVAVDTEMSRTLAAGGDTIRFSIQGHEASRTRGEHAIEVELPFLQRHLSQFRTVPITMGETSWNACEQLGRALAPWLKRPNVAVVVQH